MGVLRGERIAILTALISLIIVNNCAAFSLVAQPKADVLLWGSSSHTLDGQEIRGPITPLGNFVLVSPKEAVSATQGGILLPDDSQERPCEGEVVAAGPGKLHPHTGVRITNPVSEGMSVLYGKFDGTSLKYDSEKMQMIRDDDVMLFYSGNKMTVENATPCRDYVLIRLEEENLKTSSGIVISKTVVKDNNACIGEVVKIGEGRMCSTGLLTPSPVSIGDRAKFKDYAGNEVTIDGDDNYALVKMSNILSVQPTAE